MGLNPKYVEGMREIDRREVGCSGRMLLLRAYVAKENPQTTVPDITATVINHWTRDGEPDDAVYHLGVFRRVTVLQ